MAATVIPKEIREKLQSGDYVSALGLLETHAAKAEGNTFVVFSMLAQCALQAKEPAKAANALEIALTMSPPKENIQKIWKSLADCYDEIKSWAKHSAAVSKLYEFAREKSNYDRCFALAEVAVDSFVKAKQYEIGVNFILNHLALPKDLLSIRHVWRMVSSANKMQSLFKESRKPLDTVLSLGGSQSEAQPNWQLPHVLAENVIFYIMKESTNMPGSFSSPSECLQELWAADTSIASVLVSYSQQIKQSCFEHSDNAADVLRNAFEAHIEIISIFPRSTETAINFVALFEQVVEIWLYVRLHQKGTIIPSHIMDYVASINPSHISLNSVRALANLSYFRMTQIRKYGSVLQEFWQLKSSTNDAIYTLSTVTDSLLTYFSFLMSVISAGLDNFRQISAKTALHVTFALIKASAIIKRKYLSNCLNNLVDIVRLVRLMGLIYANQSIEYVSLEATKLLPSIFVDVVQQLSVASSTTVDETAVVVEEETGEEQDNLSENHVTGIAKIVNITQKKHVYSIASNFVEKNSTEWCEVLNEQSEVNHDGTAKKDYLIIVLVYGVLKIGYLLKMFSNYDLIINSLLAFSRTQSTAASKDWQPMFEFVVQLSQAVMSLYKEIESAKKIRMSSKSSSGSTMNAVNITCLTEYSYFCLEIEEKTAIDAIRSFQTILKSIAAFPSILADFETVIRYFVGLTMWLAGSESKLRKDPKSGSIASLLAAAKLDPNDEQVFSLIGHYYAKESKDYPRAIKCYERVLTSNPLNVEAGLGLSEVLFISGNENSNANENEKNEKLDLLLTNYAINSEFPVYWAIIVYANLLFKRKQFDQAANLFQKALEINFTDSFSWFTLGICYIQLKRDTAALKSLRKAAELSVVFDINLHIILADLERKMCLLSESKTRFLLLLKEHISETNPFFVVVAKGLANVCLLLAYQYIGFGWLSGAAQVTFEGIYVLQKAINQISSENVENEKNKSIEMLTVLLKLSGDLYCVTYQLTPMDVQANVSRSAFSQSVAHNSAFVAISSIVPQQQKQYQQQLVQYQQKLIAESFETVCQQLSLGEKAYERRLSLLQQLQQQLKQSDIESAYADIGVCKFYQYLIRLRLHGEGSGLLSTAELVALDELKSNRSASVLLSEAKQSFSLGLKVNINSSICWNGLGVCMSSYSYSSIESENNNELIAKQLCFVRATQIDNNPTAFGNLGILLALTNRIEEAKLCFAELQHLDNNPLSWLNIAYAIEKQQQPTALAREGERGASLQLQQLQFQQSIDAYLSATDITKPVEAAIGSAFCWLQLNHFLIANTLSDIEDRYQFQSIINNCDGNNDNNNDTNNIVDPSIIKHQIIDKLIYFTQSKPIHVLGWMLLSFAYELCSNYNKAIDCLLSALVSLDLTLSGAITAFVDSDRELLRKRVLRCVNTLFVASNRINCLRRIQLMNVYVTSSLQSLEFDQMAFDQCSNIRAILSPLSYADLKTQSISICSDAWFAKGGLVGNSTRTSNSNSNSNSNGNSNSATDMTEELYALLGELAINPTNATVITNCVERIRICIDRLIVNTAQQQQTQEVVGCMYRVIRFLYSLQTQQIQSGTETEIQTQTENSAATLLLTSIAWIILRFCVNDNNNHSSHPIVVLCTDRLKGSEIASILVKSIMNDKSQIKTEENLLQLLDICKYFCQLFPSNGFLWTHQAQVYLQLAEVTTTKANKVINKYIPLTLICSCEAYNLCTQLLSNKRLLDVGDVTIEQLTNLEQMNYYCCLSVSSAANLYRTIVTIICEVYVLIASHPLWNASDHNQRISLLDICSWFIGRKEFPVSMFISAPDSKSNSKGRVGTAITGQLLNKVYKVLYVDNNSSSSNSNCSSGSSGKDDNQPRGPVVGLGTGSAAVVSTVLEICELTPKTFNQFRNCFEWAQQSDVSLRALYLRACHLDPIGNIDYELLSKL